MIKKYKKEHGLEGKKNVIPDNLKKVKAKVNNRASSLNVMIRRNNTGRDQGVQRKKEQNDDQDSNYASNNANK